MSARVVPAAAYSSLASLLAEVWGDLSTVEGRALLSAIDDGEGVAVAIEREGCALARALAWLASNGWIVASAPRSTSEGR